MRVNSMFPNLILYRLHGSAPTLQEINDALVKIPFMPCGLTQKKSSGWVAPRGHENALMCESIGGQWVATYQVETRTVPSSEILKRVDQKVEAIEKETGRKPGKKERKDLKEEALIDLLPHAFTRTTKTHIWIDPRAGTLAVGCASLGKTDPIITSLVNLIPNFGVSLLHTKSSPLSCMAHWLLTQEAPPNISIDRNCVLKSSHNSSTAIRYTNHSLETQEVRTHVMEGKLPISLSLTWNDRVSFTLTDGLAIKGLRFLDVQAAAPAAKPRATPGKSAKEQTQQEKDAQELAEKDAAFDGDVAICTGELAQMVPALIAYLGGENLPQPNQDKAPARSTKKKAKAPEKGLREGEVVTFNGVVIAQGPVPTTEADIPAAASTTTTTATENDDQAPS